MWVRMLELSVAVTALVGFVAAVKGEVESRARHAERSQLAMSEMTRLQQEILKLVSEIARKLDV